MISIETLGTIPKNLEKRQREQNIRGKIEIVQTSVLLRSSGTCENGLNEELSPSQSLCENSQNVNNECQIKYNYPDYNRDFDFFVIS